MNIYLILNLEREGSTPNATVDEIRGSGYLGPLSMVTWHKASTCFTISLLAYKNMAAHAHDETPPRYVICPPVSRLLQFFASTLRVRFLLTLLIFLACLSFIVSPFSNRGTVTFPFRASRR